MRVLIVDDEPPAIERLSSMLASIDGCRVAGCELRADRVVGRCAELRPDVVLLDIGMPGLNGLELARELARQQPAPAIIFVTAHEEYAVEAFALAAIDYLVKPVRRARLIEALKRIEPGGPVSVSARLGERLIRFPIDEIRAFTSEDKCTMVHSVAGCGLIDDSLMALEAQFDGRFIRIHRNALVSSRHVRALLTDSDGVERVQLMGIELRPEVSRRNRAQIKQLIQNDRRTSNS
ncbi:MAG: LytTR family DNA-binding domain-containing protein [Xanthomonadaceae bacterium]|nr:LytTR family DNA-binding domain-containing protein [Xanthomonadaceae bacterium]